MNTEKVTDIHLYIFCLSSGQAFLQNWFTNFHEIIGWQTEF